MNTTGNSRPLAAWSVISVTASASPSYASWSATSAVSSSRRSSASSGREVVVAGRDRAQLEQVRPALLALLGAVGQHRPIAGLLEHGVEQLGQRQQPDPRAAVARTRPTKSARAVRVRGARPLGPAVGRGLETPPSTSRPRAGRRGAHRLEWSCSPMPRAGTLMIRSKADDVGVAPEHAQVGQRVLDLAPLVEARSADELVADAVAQERLLDRPALRVRAVHHRDVAAGCSRSSSSSARRASQRSRRDPPISSSTWRAIHSASSSSL